MLFSKLINRLIEDLQCLPGVGPRTAQRMAFYLLDNNRHKGQRLAKSLEEAMQQIGYCQKCRTFSEKTICALCANIKRDSSLLCIVETPSDVFAIEQTNCYSGYYFVLRGRISPLDGIGPSELGLDELQKRLTDADLDEIILATNHTVEGEATAHYITELISPFNLKLSRIAHGVPLGGELEFVDSHTLANALANRTPL
jgi:recombination protein RecR